MPRPSLLQLLQGLLRPLHPLWPRLLPLHPLLLRLLRRPLQEVAPPLLLLPLFLASPSQRVLSPCQASLRLCKRQN